MNSSIVRSLLLLGCIVLIGAGLFWTQTPTMDAPASAVATHSSDASTDFISPGGITYGRDLSGAFDSRLSHVMAHTHPDPSKRVHSVYIETTRDGIVALLDEAWKKRGPPVREGGAHGRDVYDIGMGRVIGTHGERRIRMIMEADSADIVTAYPVR